MILDTTRLQTRGYKNVVASSIHNLFPFKCNFTLLALFRRFSFIFRILAHHKYPAFDFLEWVGNGMVMLLRDCVTQNYLKLTIKSNRDSI